LTHHPTKPAGVTAEDWPCNGHIQCPTCGIACSITPELAPSSVLCLGCRETWVNECGCDWPDDCAGLGVLHCKGCGGDLCICKCGGELDCDGCDLCGWGDDLDPLDDGSDPDAWERP
jgi:hypothetical protein